MKVKEEQKAKFVDAMFNLVRALKNETELCGRICGGINEKDLMVMLFVGQHDHVKMSDIADTIEAPMSTLTSVVDKLVEKKLLLRDHSGADRRVINVSLTVAGKAAYKEVIGLKRSIAERMLSAFSEKDQNQVVEHLRALTGAIRKS